MCIRDRNYYAALQIMEERLKQEASLSLELLLEIQRTVVAGSSAEKIGLRGPMPPGVPVSYTHLDVYKRQGRFDLQRRGVAPAAEGDTGALGPLVDKPAHHVEVLLVCLLYTSLNDLLFSLSHPAQDSEYGSVMTAVALSLIHISCCFFIKKTR